jgi:hypothetical protein
MARGYINFLAGNKKKETPGEDDLPVFLLALLKN